jgi:regulator of replication initiation timing
MKKHNAVTVFAQLAEIKSQIAELRAREAELKDELSELVPENEAHLGIRHKAWDAPVVSYSKVLAEVIETVVPKTRWEQADAIKARHTSVQRRHSFVEAAL